MLDEGVVGEEGSEGVGGDKVVLPAVGLAGTGLPGCVWGGETVRVRVRGDVRDMEKPKVFGRSAKRRARRVPFPTPDGPNTTRGRAMVSRVTGVCDQREFFLLFHGCPLLSPHGESCPHLSAHPPTPPQPVDFEGDVNLFHFVLLRCVGKGAFGKVPRHPIPRAPDSPRPLGPHGPAQTDPRALRTQVHQQVKVRQDEGRRQHRPRASSPRRSPFTPTPASPSHPYLYRSTIPLSSTSDMPSKTTKTASLSSISCSVVTCAVRPPSSFSSPPHPPQSISTV